MSDDSKKITVCLASCNRFDLLEKTLDSFFSLNSYPIEKFIITEDSTISQMRDKVLAKYSDKVEFHLNKTRVGPFKTFDSMYNMVTTEYIFHCEDDWMFKNNNNFMKESLDILEEKKDIHQVWLRNPDDFGASTNDVIESEIFNTNTGVKYKMVRSPHSGDWCGFSGNPGLRRLEDYKRVFPNGLSEFILPNRPMVFTEHNCNLHAMKNGWRAANLINHVVSHLGGGRSTLL